MSSNVTVIDSTEARAPAVSQPPPPSYGRSARILSIGIASTGLVTFAYFSLASHSLSASAYAGISLLWSVMFVIVSVIYRPIEQLLSRTIAHARARGETHHQLRVAIFIQAAFALSFATVALILRPQIEKHLFNGSATLYWILFIGVLAYGASYFARGWLGGHQWFGFYGGLVFLEACSRCLFALAAAIGITHGQSVVAAGIAAAPFFSLIVVPLAFSARRRGRPATQKPESSTNLDLTRGGKFAIAVLGIMLAEQTLLNGAVLTVNATTTERAMVGFVFNVLLIARAPLQIFQAVQGSLLPHLAGLHAIAERKQFNRAVGVTLLAITGFTVIVAGGLLLLGPLAMDLLFHHQATYSRWGLAVVGIGMGAHLVAATLNQAALARNHSFVAAVAWLVTAGAFIAWMLTDVVANEIIRAEIGYCGATVMLAGMLSLIYRRPTARLLTTR